MSDVHDNTKPAKEGSFAVSPFGVISYFPIEKSAFLKPSLALIIQERANGEMVAALELRMDRTEEE